MCEDEKKMEMCVQRGYFMLEFEMYICSTKNDGCAVVTFTLSECLRYLKCHNTKVKQW